MAMKNVIQCVSWRMRVKYKMDETVMVNNSLEHNINTLGNIIISVRIYFSISITVSWCRQTYGEAKQGYEPTCSQQHVHLSEKKNHLNQTHETVLLVVQSCLLDFRCAF